MNELPTEDFRILERQLWLMGSKLQCKKNLPNANVIEWAKIFLDREHEDGVVPSHTIKDWLHLLIVDHPFKASAAILWSSMVQAILWRIWIERNHRIIKSKESSNVDVMDCSLFNALY